MFYQIQNAKVNGDTVSLSSVAAAMAKTRATAGAGFHKPTYDGSINGFTATLVSAANAGQLVVCNQFGDEIAPAEILKQAKEAASFIESPGSQNTTFAMNVCVALTRLNQWGAKRGDTFAIKDGPWIDERGWQGLHGKPPPILEFDSEPAPAIKTLPVVPSQPEAAKPTDDGTVSLTTTSPQAAPVVIAPEAAEPILDVSGGMSLPC